MDADGNTELNYAEMSSYLKTNRVPKWMAREILGALEAFDDDKSKTIGLEELRNFIHSDAWAEIQ